MKIEIELKGEIDDEIFSKVKEAVEKLKGVFIWYKAKVLYEEQKSKD
jgi:hypothetical protein